MQLLPKDDPQAMTKKTQHTPNPLAQFPSVLPPLLTHSLLEKQVPVTGAEAVEDCAVHCSLGKVTTEKSENTPRKQSKMELLHIKIFNV